MSFDRSEPPKTLLTLLEQNYSLFGILVGAVLMSISLGPYSSWDSQLEFAAASGVVKWGFPYVTFGNMINMQPFGFYISGFFLKIFGLSYQTGVGVTTLFGVGSVFLVCKVGEALYGTRTGLFAAALFALTPWQVIMSRVFLIDVQCLFFSLLFLLVGIHAIRRGSQELFFASGMLFGLALLTKLFAVFMLIPLSLIYIYWRPKSRKQASVGVTLFFSSAFLIQYLWYSPISGRGFLSIFNHDDFSSYLPSGFVVSPFFSLSFFKEALGVFFILGFALSLLVSILYRKSFSAILVFDLIFLTSIVGVVGFNTSLVMGNNMLVPYVNSIKYNYLTLPFFCLLAASMAKKCSAFLNQKNFNQKYSSVVFYVAVLGLYLLLISMIVNLMTLNMTSKYEWLEFRVDGGFSYSFDRLSPVFSIDHAWMVQFLAFTLIQASLLWSIKDRLKSFLPRSENNIECSIGGSSIDGRA